MSIFKDQLTFEPLTFERKLILKMELAGLAWLFSASYLYIVSHVFRKDLTAFGNWLLEPIRTPMKWFFQTQVLPFLYELAKHVHLVIPPEVTHFFADLFRHAGGFASALVWPMLAFGFVALGIAYHSGIIASPNARRKKFQGVLEHEWKKWQVRLFEARINIPLTPSSWIRTVFSTVVLFAVSYVVLFALFSGYLAQHVPLIFPMYEPGMNNWFLASLKDAHIAVPKNWFDYSAQFSNVLDKYIDFDNPKLHTMFLPMYGFPQMPPDLFRLRLFVAAVCGFLGAFPFTLSMLAVGVDSFAGRHLTLTPTRLLDTRSSFYFLTRTIQYKWSDLVRANLSENEETSETILNLEFSQSRKLPVHIKHLSPKDRRILFQALDELAPVCQFNDELKKLMSESRKESPVGYTIFWDDELSSKRRSTVFVPMDQGATLKDGRLEILRQLSGQGWSATYLARFNGEFVVVRESILSKETEAGRRAWTTLENEAKILGSLDHPGIAKVLDHFVENERSYLLLEYVVGTDLRKKTSLSARLSNKTVIEIAERVCDILTYLHNGSPSVIHRDISPDNLVVTPNGDVRLIDFAASKLFVETATGTMIGKRSYMAPEQLRGKASVRSDIYSLGATMHYLLTGQDPLALAQCQPAEQRSDIDSGLGELIREMTSFDENDRPASATQVKQRLSRLRENRGTIGSIRDGLSPEYVTIKLKRYEAQKL